jgi:hypothetical protein
MSNQRPRVTRPLLLVSALAIVAVALGMAAPKPSYIFDFDALYPVSQSDENVENGTGTVCQMCHQSTLGQDGWNPYGWSLRQLIDAGTDPIDAFTMVGTENADGDAGGASNEDEIAADTQPGWTTGSNNTIYFMDGSTLTNQRPPSGILGDLDPPPPVGTWTDLGNALAGTHGLPLLVGTGDLVGGTPVTLTLSNALENATTYLLVGVVTLNAPFKGGVMVPDPNAPGFFVILPTGPAGTLPLNATWPNGLPSGFSLYFQHWIVDATGPAGFAASNALQATTP